MTKEPDGFAADYDGIFYLKEVLLVTADVPENCPVPMQYDSGHKYPKIVIPAEAGIASRTVGVCQKIPASAGMMLMWSVLFIIIKEK